MARTTPAGQHDPRLGPREEAQLVCDEMALRARRNIEVIIDRLSTDGYQFDPDDDQAHVVPFIPATAGQPSMRVGFVNSSMLCR
ncbi:hypothetical protein [Nocardia rhizosphaerihabitans]|nr:hypothetical protein [Nocardia rhizosphaerihabitans]